MDGSVCRCRAPEIPTQALHGRVIADWHVLLCAMLRSGFIASTFRYLFVRNQTAHTADSIVVLAQISSDQSANNSRRQSGRSSAPLGLVTGEAETFGTQINSFSKPE